jgi:prepilin-type processing-associated H-X9-DG protein
MAQNDYAILVGISRYADASLRRLDGPVRDVRLIYDWLVKPERCNVPPANITRIVTDEAAQAVSQGDMPPVFQDFLNAFIGIVRGPDKSNMLRPDGRLYLYLSGHGFCEKYTRDAHAALYVANADRDLNWNIFGTYFARWARDQGLFGEIVLIMDCCRDAELAKSPLIPPLRKPTDVNVARDSRLFELYAAPRGGKAQERPIPTRNNEVHGLLTSAFIEAIDHAEPGKTNVTTQAIKEYLEERWKAICGDQPADPPEIIVPSNGEIRFNRPASADLMQRLSFKSLHAGDQFKLIRSDFAEVAQIALADGQANVAWADGHTSALPIRDDVLELPLPATFYMAIAATAKGLVNRNFQAGDQHVEL